MTWNDVGVTLVGVAETPPPKSTRSAPLKPLPVIVTNVPTAPLVGVKLWIFGSTVKVPDVVVVPPGFVTAIGPVRAPAGTPSFRVVAETTTNAAPTPPTFAAVVPVNVLPVSVTTVPAVPSLGVNDSSIVGRTLSAVALEGL